MFSLAAGSPPKTTGVIYHLEVSMISYPLFSFGPIGALLPDPLSLEVVYARDAPGMVAGISGIRGRLPGQRDGESLNNIGFSLGIGNAFSNSFALYLKPGQ